MGAFSILLCCVCFIFTVYGALDYCEAPLTVPLRPNGLPRNATLKAVNLLARHGDRLSINPLYRFPYAWNCSEADVMGVSPLIPPIYRKRYYPDKQELKGNCGAGQLTVKGVRQHMALGKNLRKKYVEKLNFLPEKFSPSLIALRSTDSIRTLQSCEANIFGMYPEHSLAGDSFRDIFVVYTKLDPLQPWNTGFSCRRAAKVDKELFKSEGYLKFVAKNQDLFDRAQEAFGVRSVSGVLRTTNDFLSRVCHDVPLPNEVPLSLIDQLDEMVSESWRYEWEYEENSNDKLVGGPIVALFVKNFQNVIDKKTRVKYFANFAHDTTIGPLLSALKVYHFEKRSPAYTSHVEMELYHDSRSGYFVSLAYNGRYLPLPCGDTSSSTVCSWDSFLAFTQAASYYVDSKAACSSRFDPGKSNSMEDIAEELFDGLRASNEF